MMTRGAKRFAALAAGILALVLFSCPGRTAEDWALLIGAGNYASGKWGLPLVAENLRLMQKALIEEVGLDPSRVVVLADRDVTKTGVWRALSEIAQKAAARSGVILYYSGHAAKVTVSGAPVRAYFTWDTMESPGGDGFEPATLITDVELGSWLRPLSGKGAAVIVIREACFCGGGYAQDIANLSPGKPPAKSSVADIEISACDVDQAAWALEGAAPPKALFTACLAEALASEKQQISIKELYDDVHDRVTRKRAGQTPILEHAKGLDPAEIYLVDRTKVDLIVEAKDEVTGEPLSDAKVVVKIPGEAEVWSGLTPAVRLLRIPRHAMLFPWIEKPGYVPKSQAVKIPAKDRTVKAEVVLAPEVAVIKGRVKVEGPGPAVSIRVAYESGGRPASPRHVDSEVRPGSDGTFELRVPARGPCRLMVVSGAETLTTVDVAAGAGGLKPVRYFDSAAGAFSGQAYDVGEIAVRVQPAAPVLTEAEKGFERYFQSAQDAEDLNHPEEALRLYKAAQDAAAHVPDAVKKKDLNARAGSAVERIETALRAARYENLVKQGEAAREAGQLAQAQGLAEQALALNPSGVMAQILLKDVKGLMALAAPPPSVEKPAPSVEPTRPKPAPTGKPGADFAFLREETFACGGATHTVKIYKHAKTGLEFVVVPGGTFTLGSPRSEKNRERNEGPVEGVTVRPFLLCRTEVTQGVWEKIMGSQPWHDKKNVTEGAQFPATFISWADCQDFCGRAGLRLPSEAEWEFACRAGTATRYCSGDADEEVAVHAWLRPELKERGEEHAQPVAQKKPNAFGLFDMHGNVWEWCQDTESAYDKNTPRDGGPREEAGVSMRIVRGGSWYFAERDCRSARRVGKGRSGTLQNDVGFRPAADLE